MLSLILNTRNYRVRKEAWKAFRLVYWHLYLLDCLLCAVFHFPVYKLLDDLKGC
jgi:hypothetical protein